MTVLQWLEEALYEAPLAARCYEAVDPAKRVVTRELESRWNTALERVADLEARISRHEAAASLRSVIDEAALNVAGAGPIRRIERARHGH
jgi:hypothetical protein